MKDSFRTSKTLSESRRHAVRGIKLIIENERNFRIQLAVAVVVITLSIILKISHTHWIAVGLLISLVLVTEAFNSVIEAVCDTVSRDYRVNIKYAKDVAAGAVLVSAILSVLLGLIIFIPYLVPIVEELLNK